jgi:hypothetical protein
MSSQLKKIAKAIFIIVILALPFMASAQRMDTPVIDGFTHDTTFSTTQANVSMGSDAYLDAYFSRQKDGYYLHLRVDLPVASHKSFKISKGNSVIIKFGDNTTLNLTNTNDAESTRIAYAGQRCWVADVACSISKDDMFNISRASITGIRVQDDKENVDFGISPDDSAAMKKMLLLILTH